MIRTLRGGWSRRWTLLPLLLLTTVVVGGTVTVISFAGAAGTSPLLAVPLLLLGVVAVPGTARELATARREEVALARLRGLEGGELSALLTAEPLIVLVLGGAAGTAVGAVGGRVAAAIWAQDADSSGPTLDALLAVLAIIAVGLLAVVVGMAGSLNEPLVQQVSVATRPRTSSVLAIFGSILVIVAAVVAAYRSSVATDDPDWVVLAGPALVGIAVGQVVVWVLRAIARVGVPATARRGLGGFLAVRRLARVVDAVTPVRLLVAAAVVAALAVTGAGQVAAWTDDTARLRAGAPLQVPLDVDAPTALELSRDLDPGGEYLMAAVLVPGTGAIPNRRAFLDTERFDAVLGDFYAGTPASGIESGIEVLGGGAGPPRGDAVLATVAGVSARRQGEMRPQVRVTYAAADRVRRVHLSFEIGLDGAPDAAEAPLAGCLDGCTITGIQLDRTVGDTGLPWVLTRLDFAGRDALALDWQPARGSTLIAGPGGPVQVDEGLMAVPAEGPLDALPEMANDDAVPILATESAVWPDGPPLLDSPGGDERPAEVVQRLPGLPLVEADGVLADLSRAAAGAPPTVPAAEVMMLARADTPPELLAGLEEVATGAPQTLAEVRQATTAEARSAQAAVYTLMAVCCLLVALLVLATAVARQRSTWLRDVAALRVLGVDSRRLRRAGWWEVIALALATVAGTTVGAVLAVRLLLPNLSLVMVPDHAVPLQTSVAAGPIAVASGAAALVVLVVAGRGRSLAEHRTRPALLREEALR